jgi:hypothetical protein
MARQCQSRDVRNMLGSNDYSKMTRPSIWRDTLKRLLTGSATDAAANAIMNAIMNMASAIVSRMRRGTTVPQQPTSSQVKLMPAVPQLPVDRAMLSERKRGSSAGTSHQPRSLRVMTSERVLNDNRQSLFNVVDKNTARKNNSIVKKITSKIPIDEHTFLTKVKLTLCNLLEQHRNMKIKLNLVCIMTRTDMATGEQQDDEAKFWSETHKNFPATDLNDLYELMKEKVLDAFAAYLNKGSSWRFKKVKSLAVHIDKNIPLRGSSYKDLPKFIKDKKAVNNIKNADNECFRWYILRALNPVNKNAERISDLKSKISPLNWGNMTFPVKLKDIGKFEKLNPNYAVNVMGLAGTCVYPLRKSNVNTNNQINLLLHDEHYSLIKNFGRLVSSQISKHHNARFYCYRCLSSFTCKEALQNHEEYCKNHCMARIDISKDPVKFKNSRRAMRVPFTIYADFETFNVKINSCQPNPNQS